VATWSETITAAPPFSSFERTKPEHPRHHHALIDGAHAGIVGRLNAIESALEEAVNQQSDERTSV
jgi:hypothetical protein